MRFDAEIILTIENVDEWRAFREMLDDGRVVADGTGRLRYPHGAPIGKMILVRINKDGSPRYQESAEDWFDPESSRAKAFVWP